MKALLIGSILSTIISAGMLDGVGVLAVGLILASLNIVVWIKTAPKEEDVWPQFVDSIKDGLEAEDGA